MPVAAVLFLQESRNRDPFATGLSRPRWPKSILTAACLEVPTIVLAGRPTPSIPTGNPAAML